MLTDKLTSRVAVGVAVLLALVLAVVLISKNATIRHLDKQLANVQKRLDSSERDNATLRTNQTALEHSIAVQNASVEAAVAAAAQRAQQAEKARGDAAKAATGAAAKAAELTKVRRSGDLAASTDALILESLK